MEDDDSNFEVSSYHICPDAFDHVLGKTFLNSFSLSHVNIRSLSTNFDELSLLIDNLESQFDVMALSEVWNVSDTALFGLTGYTLEVKCRTANARGGDVGAYIRSSYVIQNFEVTLPIIIKFLTIHKWNDISNIFIWKIKRNTYFWMVNINSILSSSTSRW